jgi:hypothetical protein
MGRDEGVRRFGVHFVLRRTRVGFENSMVPNYDVCRVGLEPGTLKALRELVAHVQRPPSEVMNNGDYTTIISSRVKERRYSNTVHTTNSAPGTSTRRCQNGATGPAEDGKPIRKTASSAYSDSHYT